MALGLTPSATGGVMAPADVRGAGELEWAETSGVRPTNPLVGGPQWPGGAFGGADVDVDRGRSILVTTPEGQAANTGGIMVPVGHPGMGPIANWREMFDFRGSPMPWLLLAALILLGFMEFRLQARARAGRGRGRAELAMG
jgi:hypothetical protein